MHSKTDKKSTNQYAGTDKIRISEARKLLPKLVNALGEDPNRVFELDRYDTPSALLLSYDVYKPIVQALQTGDLVPILANLLANKWLGVKNVPAHISKPQIDELESMGLAQLLVLFQELPCDSINELQCKNTLDERLMNRLVHRRQIAKAISDAEEEGLYEASEHLSGSV